MCTQRHGWHSLLKGWESLSSKITVKTTTETRSLQKPPSGLEDFQVLLAQDIPQDTWIS